MRHTLFALSFFCGSLMQSIYAQEPAEAVDAYDYDGDYEEPEDKEYTPEEQAAALETLKGIYASQLKIILNVHDKESADAAVDLLRKQFLMFTPELLHVLDSTDYEARAQLNKAASRQLKAKHQELKQQLYFGSTLLAKELAGSTSYTVPATPLPEDYKAKLIKDTPYDTSEDVRITGGNGFTKESAWKLTVSRQQPAQYVVLHHIDATLDLSSVLESGWDFSNPTLSVVFADNKAYMLLKMDLYSTADTPVEPRHELEQWFDLSASYPFGSEAEWHAQLERMIDNIANLQTALGRIQNKESADAEAAHITTLLADIRAGYTAYYLLNDDSELHEQFHLKAAQHTRTMKAEVERIRKANHFDSVALKKVIKDKGKIID